MFDIGYMTNNSSLPATQTLEYHDGKGLSRCDGNKLSPNEMPLTPANEVEGRIDDRIMQSESLSFVHHSPFQRYWISM